MFIIRWILAFIIRWLAIRWLKEKWIDFKIWRAYRKKIKKLKEQDPFIYK